MTPPSGILAWGSHGQRNLMGYSPWGRKESDTTEATQHSIASLSGGLAQGESGAQPWGHGQERGAVLAGPLGLVPRVGRQKQSVRVLPPLLKTVSL